VLEVDASDTVSLSRCDLFGWQPGNCDAAKHHDTSKTKMPTAVACKLLRL
jgi:hypothetical protein